MKIFNLKNHTFLGAGQFDKILIPLVPNGALEDKLALGFIYQSCDWHPEPDSEPEIECKKYIS